MIQAGISSLPTPYRLIMQFLRGNGVVHAIKSFAVINSKPLGAATFLKDLMQELN